MKSSHSCKKTASRPAVEQLLDRFQRGDRRALAQLISLAARGEHLEAIGRVRPPADSQTLVVAITGSAGVGKSTIIGGLAAHLRDDGRSVAVLACDPESPVTGGALLGDRIRMSSRADDDGIFIRSLSASGGRQAVAGHLDAIVGLTRAYGFDVVLLETVGAGQGDTAVRAIADWVVLLIQPESGDDLQWQKAGLIEIADIVVVQKGDLAGADRLEAELRDTLSIPGGKRVAITRTTAKENQGIDQLWRIIESLAQPCDENGG